MLDRKLLLGSTVIAGVAAAFAVATPAVSWAQTAPATPAQSSASDDSEVEALVVTGSRIKRSEFTSTAPVQVITAEQATLEGLVDTAEILQQSSIATGSTQINNQLTGFVVDGGPGVNTISLRGLGANRTLVLLNGRRLGPAGIGGTVGPVDLNVIPSSIIERVEILKDGASSIYGSDAVAGVVNIITRTSLDGGELSVFGTQGEEGGGEQYRINGAWGKTFDRGYVSIAADWYRQEALRRKDRDDTACAADYLQGVDADGRPNGRIDYRGLDGNYKCYNLLNNVFQVSGYGGSFQYRVPGITYPTTPGTQVNSNWGGTAAQLIRAARANAGTPESFPYANYDSKYYDEATVISPVDRYTLYGTFGFDLTDTVELYGELMWNRRESRQDSVRQLFPAIAVSHPSVTSTFVTGGLGIPLTYDPDGPAGPAPAGPTRLTPVIATPYTFEQKVDYTRAVVGLRGNFGDAGFLSNWDWDIYSQFSHSDGEYTKDIIYQDRVYALTTGATPCDPNPVSDSGVPVGNVSGFNCANLPGGIPWFSQRVLAGQWTDAERAFLFAKETSKTTYDTALVEASISGDMFTLPAGPVGGAFGVTYRREEINDEPGPVSRAYNIWGLTSSAVTKGEDKVWEVFGEVDVPIAKGLPGIESLTANISGRYSNYDSYGSGDTYKIGLNWQIVDAWRIRATHGTSFRAPGLFEQFLGGQTGFLGQSSIDPCVGWDAPGARPNVAANCAAIGMPADYNGLGTSSALVQAFGNQDLEAETSKATTIGVIWSPSFIDLRVAVDYFEIKVDDEVTRFGASNILFQCYNSDPTVFAAGTNPFCGLATRQLNPLLPRFREVTYVRDDYTNIAKQTNRGIDLTFRYGHDFDFGEFTLDGQFTWQLEDVSTLLIGSSETDYNGTTNTYDGPDFSGSLNFRFDRGDWTLFWGVDMYGKGSDTETFGGDTFGNTRYQAATYYKQYTEFTAYHDFSVRKRQDDWTFQAGIQNVFDEGAPAQSAGQFRAGTAALNSFDLIGRRLFVNISKKW